jgi:predicted ATPase/DNA-binding SARP family transcriptional activator
VDARWRIRLLGALAAERGRWKIARLRSEKAAALLARLAFRPGERHPRERLVELLWPGADPASGRHSLSMALSALRHALEPPGIAAGSVVLADRAGAALAEDAVSTDVRAFEAALADAGRDPDALEAALARYGGELLPELYDDWVLAERDRLRSLFLGASHELVAALLERGEATPRALAAAQRAVAADPLGEEAARDLIRAQLARGEPAAALLSFRDFERRLERELGAGPAEATRALVRGVLAPPLPPPAPEPPRPPPARAAPPAPLELSTFFGREEEIAWLRAALAPGGARLVTASGPGGIGKTRLALELARVLAAEGRTVRFAPLADLEEAALIPGAILAVLGKEPAPLADPLDEAARALAGDAGLLILDNFEQLLAERREPGGRPRAEEATGVVRALLERVPALACLVTSRRRLGLAGERELALRPLPLGAGAASVRLFVDRARAARPDFALTAENAAAVAAIVERLEGIPLALILAAARLQVLSPEDLLERLRLDLLTSRDPAAPARQRTLRATLDWSYRLLAPPLAPFFAALSAFHGGFTLEAVEAVLEEPEAIDRLADLCECSLASGEGDGARRRFRLLEVIREYAQEKLEPAGAGALAARHAAFFCALAERAGSELKGPGGGGLVDRLEAELPNVRAALDWCERHAPETGLRIATGLQRFWSFRGHVPEALARTEALLARAPAPGALRAAGLRTAGIFAGQTGDLARARARFEEALRLFREAGDLAAAAGIVNNLGLVAHDAGEVRAALALFEEAARLQAERGNPHGAALSRLNQATILAELGELAEGARRLAETAAALREMGDRRALSVALANLAHFEVQIGAVAAARAHAAESLAAAEAAGDDRGRAFALASRGFVHEAEGDLAAARALYEASIAGHRRLGLSQPAAGALCALGEILARTGDAAGARARAEEALASGGALERVHALRLLGELDRREGDRAAAERRFRGALEIVAASGARAWAAPALEGLAAGAEEPARAARFLGAAAALREAVGTPARPFDEAARAQARERLERALGREALEREIAAGRALSLEAAIDLARAAPAVG